MENPALRDKEVVWGRALARPLREIHLAARRRQKLLHRAGRLQQDLVMAAHLLREDRQVHRNRKDHQAAVNLRPEADHPGNSASLIIICRGTHLHTKQCVPSWHMNCAFSVKENLCERSARARPQAQISKKEAAYGQ